MKFATTAAVGAVSALVTIPEGVYPDPIEHVQIDSYEPDFDSVTVHSIINAAIKGWYNIDSDSDVINE